MPRFKTRRSTSNMPALKEVSWDNFRRGLNTLLRETEIRDDELSEATNLRLVGKGVPTKRWGQQLFFQAGATGSVRNLSGFYKKDGTNELVAITDWGYLTIKNGASYTLKTGVSWASGYDISSVQLNDTLYLVSPARELVKYSSPTLIGFPTIATPANVFATQWSGASGAYTYAYRVSAVSNSGGETLASTSISLPTQPQDLSIGAIRVNWGTVSTASGVLRGYNLYGRTPADERFLSFVPAGTTTFLDDGSAIPQEFTFPPPADSTGGLKAKYIERYQDRLIYGGISSDPTMVVISGRVPNHEKNDVASGGNYIRIEPDSGDDITGIKVFRERIIVFKQRSIWQITLSTTDVGNFTITIPNATLLTSSHGCVSYKSIAAIENDLFFLTRNGIYSLGDEPNILNVLRTNEISARIREDLQNMSASSKMKAAAFYKDFTYGIAFPGEDKLYIYDRERLAWMGPWTFDGNVFETYFDTSDNEYLVRGADDEPMAYDVDDSYKNDNGTNFTTSLQTKKGDFGTWNIFKLLRQMFYLFRNISGTVNVSIKVQDRFGDIVTIKSFSLTSNSVSDSGWGSSSGWGDAGWGDSLEVGSAADINETYRWSELNKIVRNYQVVVETTDSSNYELLSIQAKGKPAGTGNIPMSEKV